MDGALLQILLSGLAAGTVYGMTAAGLNIIYNASGAVNFAQGEFVMLGALCAASLTPFLGAPAGAIAGAFCAAIAGYLTWQLLVRPAHKHGVLRMILVTLAASMLWQGLALIIWGREIQVIKTPAADHIIKIFSASLTEQHLHLFTVFVIMLFSLWWFFRHTQTGKQLRASSSHPAAAALYGISAAHSASLAFMLSAFTSGLAGALFAPLVWADARMGTLIAVKAFAAAVLGGLGRFSGALAGGLFIGVAESFGAAFLPANFRDVYTLALILLLLTLRPGGFLKAKG